MRSSSVIFALLVALLGCNETSTPAISSESDANSALATTAFVSKTFVYDCENSFSLVARLDHPERLWVFFPQKTQQLDRVQSASGEKYAHGDNWLWFKGGDLMVNFNDALYKRCENQPQKAVWEHAKLSGVSYRAIGNEPGWVLEITQGEQLVYIGDYGATQLNFAFQQPSVNGAQTRYIGQHNNQNIEVTISPTHCVDSMSGQAFSTSVNLVVNGKTLSGCGKALY